MSTSVHVGPGRGDVPAELVRRRRVTGRIRVVGLLLGAAVLVAGLAVAALMLGAADLTGDAVLRGLLGVGSKSENLIVGTLRLPRIQAALLAGAAFGLAGAVFQSVLRNPLASPDILGISSGASLGAVVAVLGWGWSGVAVSLSAFAGALTVAALIWGLAWRQGLHGLRFVLVGVGLAYLSGSLISWLLSQADVREAQPVLLWTVGSVADVRGGELGGLALLVALFAVVVALAARPLRVLPLGDELASGLGIAPDRARLVLLLAAVGLVASATSVAGPIAFVALLAAPIARRLQDDGGPALFVAAAVGALLTLAADVLGQHAVPGVVAPVGVVTGLIGAPYLLFLLARQRKVAA